MKWKTKHRRLLKRHRAYRGKIKMAIALMQSPLVFSRIMGMEMLGLEPFKDVKYQWFEREPVMPPTVISA